MPTLRFACLRNACHAHFENDGGRANRTLRVPSPHSNIPSSHRLFSTPLELYRACRRRFPLGTSPVKNDDLRWGAGGPTICYNFVRPWGHPGETDTDVDWTLSRLYAKRRTLNTRKVQDLSAHFRSLTLCQCGISP